MAMIIPFFALAGIGDVPLFYWCFVPTFIAENHSSPMMVIIQGGGLAIILWMAVRLMLKQKVEWRSKRLFIFAGYPLVVFTSNAIGLIFNQW